MLRVAVVCSVVSNTWGRRWPRRRSAVVVVVVVVVTIYRVPGVVHPSIVVACLLLLFAAAAAVVMVVVCTYVWYVCARRTGASPKSVHATLFSSLYLIVDVFYTCLLYTSDAADE